MTCQRESTISEFPGQTHCIHKTVMSSSASLVSKLGSKIPKWLAEATASHNLAAPCIGVPDSHKHKYTNIPYLSGEKLICVIFIILSVAL